MTNQLPRSLTLFSAVMLVVGNVVGAGIFTTAGMLAEEVSQPAAFIGVWILGGLLTLIGSLTYAELGAMFPRAGGDYQFIKEAYGPLAGFCLGWLGFMVIFPGSIAALSIALVEHIPGLPESISSSRWAALPVVFLLGLLNYRSTRLATSTQSIITVGSLLLLAGLIIGGALTGNGNTHNFTTLPSTGFHFSGSAMIAVFFTYSGWFAAAYVGSEVIRPERNVPLALVLGTLTVTVLYTAVNAIYLYALPLNELRSAAGTNAAELTAAKLFGPKAAWLTGAAVLLAIASCINASVMTGARVCYALAEDRIFPSALKRIHPRFSTPHTAVAAQTILAVIYVLAGSFEKILGYVVFAMLLSNIAAGIAHLKLRRSKPELQRPYKTLLAPIVPILFAAAHAWFAFQIAADQPFTSLVGIGIVLTAVPVYLLRRRFSNQR